MLVSGAGQSDLVIFKKLRSWIPVPSLHGKQKGEKKKLHNEAMSHAMQSHPKGDETSQS